MSAAEPGGAPPRKQALGVAGWARQHVRSILFLLGLLGALGVLEGLSLPVGLFPHVSFPRIQVGLDAGDRPAERMGIEVTWPVEEAVRAVPGVRGVRSTTTRGSADISITFDWGDDMASAMLQVQAAIAAIVPELPPGTSFEVRRMDPTVFPVLGYSLTSVTVDQVGLRDAALYQLRPLLSTVKGVAKVVVQGGDTAELEVTVDPAKLVAFGLTLEDISRALSASNVLTAVGRVEEHDKLYLVLSDTRLRSVADVENTIIRAAQGGLVLLEGLATVSQVTSPRWTRVTADGKDAVLVLVYQQPGGNTVAIADGVRARLAELEPRLPAGVHIANWYDQSDLIVSSAGSVRDAVLIGIGMSPAWSTSPTGWCWPATPCR